MIAEPLFLAHYIEKVGTGTLDMIAGCQSAELPEPEFFQNGDQFVLRIWREWLTADVLTGLGLNERQTAAMAVIRQQRRITTGEYQRAAGARRATAKRDLEDLVRKGLLTPMGAGRGAYYEPPKKWLINGSIGSSSRANRIGSETAQTAHRIRTKQGTNRTNATSAARNNITSKSTRKKSGKDERK